MADPSGQVATQTGHAEMQGFTAVFGLFSVPKALVKPAGHLPSTLDTTPAGLAMYLTARPRPTDQLAAAAGAPTRGGPAESPTRSPSAEDVPDADAIESMGVKALKGLIERAGLSHRDCVEKGDLRERAKEAAGKLCPSGP